jgi:Zn-dependent M28 family amino/carboxypeptidase
MRKFLLAAAAAAVVLSAGAAAPTALAADAARADDSRADLATAAQLRDAALKANPAYEIVASLTTEVGPRLAGSPGDRAAVAWAVAKLKALGYENVRTQEVIVPQWVRGEASARVVAPYPQPFATVALGGSIGTPEDGLEADVVAFPDVEALRAAPREQVEGRIVYLGKRTAKTPDGRGYGEAVRGRSTGPSHAAALGAVALVIRSIGTSTQRFAHTGGTVYDISQPKIPAVAISNPDADLLERQLASGKPVRMHVRVTARDLPRQKSANVIGEIPGTDLADEVVLLGAHLDSWDLGQGALDDGAGVAIVAAVGAMLKERGLKPRRTIRVVLFANEEFGLSGATEYAKAIGEEASRHHAAIEADLGSGRIWKFSSRVRPEALPTIRAIARVLQPIGIQLGDNEAGGGADLRPLRPLGVPVFTLQHDATQYFEVHHTANDTLERVDRAELDQSVAAYAAAAWLFAQSPVPFGPVETAAPAPAPAR